METRVDKVAEKHKSGYNCAQAVACAYCDLIGIDEETMFRLTEGLGLGMGGMEGTCGAVTAACVIAGARIVLWKWVVREVKGQLIKYPKKLCVDSKRRAAT